MPPRLLAGRRGPIAALLTILAVGACSDQQDVLTGPETRRQAGPPIDVPRAIAAQERYTGALMATPGVVGTAVGLDADGSAVVRVFLSAGDVGGIPSALDGVPVSAEVTGLFFALSNTTARMRPAPLGYSIGHPDITAGTIGARVVDGSGQIFILSNNHVLANSNGASIGDPAYQPGPYDGGTAADQIATLADYYSIKFTSRARNTMDAAIAASSAADVGFATPSVAEGGYGAPSATLFGDADGNGLFDNRGDLLGVPVQKYGRTTHRTTGTITAVNATVSVCYEAFIFCTKAGRFVDQIIVGQSGYSAGGDSGSLVVTNDGNRQPVGLLFAGSSAETIVNRIDLVLDHFNVSIDDGGGTPPTPTTDVAVTNVSAPSPVTGGDVVDVTVTVRNSGNQDVGGFNVALDDATDATGIGTQFVNGLTAGATTTLTFSWNTGSSSYDDHVLTASHDLSDDNDGNDANSTTSRVLDPSAPVGIHVGDLDVVYTSNEGRTWSATVEVAIHDGGHDPINGVRVTGSWSFSQGFGNTECVTGDGGGNGTCIFLLTQIRKNANPVVFTVESVSMDGETYVSGQNHDDDGDSNGTTITVNKP